MRALLSAFFFVAVAVAPARAHGPMSGDPVACGLPDVVAAWHVGGGNLPLLTDSVPDSRAGIPGRTYHVVLQPCANKHCEPGTWAGLFPIVVPAAGRYRVAVGDASLWLDVITPTGKAEGVMCEQSGCDPIRKIVQFELRQGPQWVQLVSRKPTEADLLVMPVREGMAGALPSMSVPMQGAR